MIWNIIIDTIGTQYCKPVYICLTVKNMGLNFIDRNEVILKTVKVLCALSIPQNYGKVWNSSFS